MRRHMVALISLIASLDATAARAQTTKYPSIDAYLMPRDAEIALARSAAPGPVSDRDKLAVKPR